MIQTILLAALLDTIWDTVWNVLMWMKVIVVSTCQWIWQIAMYHPAVTFIFFFILLVAAIGMIKRFK